MLSSQVKFSADRWKDRQTHRQTDTVKQYAPNLSMQEHKKKGNWMIFNLLRCLMPFHILSFYLSIPLCKKNMQKIFVKKKMLVAIISFLSDNLVYTFKGKSIEWNDTKHEPCHVKRELNPFPNDKF